MQRLTVIALLLVSVTACSGPKETFLLKPDPAEGKYVVESGMVVDGTCRFSSGGHSSMHVELGMEIRSEIKNRRPDGSFEQHIRIVRYRIKQVVDGKPRTEGDTATGVYGDETIRKIAETILAGRFMIGFSPDGKVTTSSGFEQFSREIDAIPEDENYKGMIANMRDSFQQQFVDALNDGDDIFSKQAVGVGQSWKFEPRESMTYGGKYRNEGKTRFQSLEKDSSGDSIAVLRHTVTGEQIVPRTVEYDACKAINRDGREKTVTTARFNIDQKFTVESNTETTRTYRIVYDYNDPSDGNVTGNSKDVTTSWSKVRRIKDDETETESEP